MTYKNCSISGLRWLFHSKIMWDLFIILVLKCFIFNNWKITPQILENIFTQKNTFILSLCSAVYYLPLLKWITHLIFELYSVKLHLAIYASFLKIFLHCFKRRKDSCFCIYLQITYQTGKELEYIRKVRLLHLFTIFRFNVSHFQRSSNLFT